jgi:hypothetical protein
MRNTVGVALVVVSYIAGTLVRENYELTLKTEKLQSQISKLSNKLPVSDTTLLITNK